MVIFHSYVSLPEGIWDEIQIPIGSLTFGYIWGILMVNVIPYIAYMDPMGYEM